MFGAGRSFDQSLRTRPGKRICLSPHFERSVRMLFESTSRRLLLTTAVILAAGPFTPFVRPASAQGVVMLRNISLPMAKAMAEAALAECKSKGFNTSVAVVDRVGQVLVIMRDERATAQTAEMARRKAYTAVMFR